MDIIFGYTFTIFLLVTFPPARFAASESAIIITGGYDGYDSVSFDDDVSVSVEVLRANGSYWCSLPDLPHGRDSHSQSGLEACGGIGDCITDESCVPSSCVAFSNGEWRPSHTLAKFTRWEHTAWQSQQGVVLIGGKGDIFYDTEMTTDILLEDGQSLPFFVLKHYTSGACSIELEDKVIVTGSITEDFHFNKVDMYTYTGWIMELPDLITERFNHGCGHFINSDNKMVYLVTGGGGANGLFPLGLQSSTETLVEGSEAWTEVGELPVAIIGLRGVSLNNNIFMTGGQDDDQNQNTNTLQYNPDDGSWSVVGQLNLGRSWHGASVINAEEISEYCA